MQNLLTIILYSLALFLSLEFLASGSLNEPMTVLKPLSSILNNNSAIAVLKIVLIYTMFFSLFIFIIYSITENLTLSSVIFSILVFTFYLIDYYKKSITGSYLSPEDFQFIKNIGSIASFASFSVDYRIFTSFTIILLSLFCVFFSQKKLNQQNTKNENSQKTKKSFIIKKLTSILLPTTFLLIILCTTIGKSILTTFISLNVSDFNSSSTYIQDKNGKLLGFYLLNQKDKILSLNSIPSDIAHSKQVFDKNKLIENYSDQTMEKVLSEVNQQIYIEPNKSDNPVKPNVIVIMSEAFWDPTRLSSVTFSSDPLSNYRELSKSFTSGNVISPVIGGLTANVEYELLVGDSMKFYNSGTVPFEKPKEFINLIDNRALPNQFKNGGYKTVALHPYQNFFYNRNTIYPKLGFDEFISIEDMQNPTKKGEFVSDEFFTNQIINQIENTSEPLFLFGVSMQNHFQYYPNKYNHYDITTSSKTLSPIELSQLDTFTQGVFDADKQLKVLVDYLESQEKPTILLFFGDHLPLLGNNALNYYDKANYTSSTIRYDWTIKDKLKMHSTPYLLWTNFKTQTQSQNFISPMFLGANLLNMANLEKDFYWDYLYKISKDFHVLHEYLFVDSQDTVFIDPNQENINNITNLFYLNYQHLNRKQ